MCFGRELRPSHALGRIGFSPPCQRQSRTLGLNLDCAEVSLFSMQVLAFSSRYKGITAGIFSLLPWMSSFLRVAPQAVFAYAPHCSLHGKAAFNTGNPNFCRIEYKAICKFNHLQCLPTRRHQKYQLKYGNLQPLPTEYSYGADFYCRHQSEYFYICFQFSIMSRPLHAPEDD